MTDAEKQEISAFLERIYAKTVEVHAMIKDGKIVVAYEKLGGVLKVIQQLGSKVESVQIS